MARGIFLRIMTSFCIRPLVLLLALLMPLLVNAQPANHYRGLASMEDGETMAGAQRQALNAVLTRLTGQSSQTLSEELSLSAADVSALIASQQRVRQPQLMPDGSRPEQTLLQVDFFPPAVDRLLRLQGLPRLGPERPAILVWLLVDEEPDVEAEQLEGEGAPSAAALADQHLADLAARFGLDFVQPLNDAFDLSHVGPSDIRGGFLESADPLLDRYDAGMTAMLDLRRDEQTEWQARWFWRMEGRDHSLVTHQPFMGDALEAGAAALLQTMVERFGVRLGGESSRVRQVRVDGLFDAGQFAAVQQHLSGFSVVEAVRVLAARDQAVDFEIEVAGEGIEDQLAFSRLLVVDDIDSDGFIRVRWLQ